MTFLKTILPFAACALLASNALADADTAEFTPVDPSVIEQLVTDQDSPESVPEPGTFGAVCLGIATIIYARRWRRRS